MYKNEKNGKIICENFVKDYSQSAKMNLKLYKKAKNCYNITCAYVRGQSKICIKGRCRCGKAWNDI